MYNFIENLPGFENLVGILKKPNLIEIIKIIKTDDARRNKFIIDKIKPTT